MANAMLSVMHAIGLEEVQQFGDSTTSLDLNSAAPPPTGTEAARG